MATYIRLDWNNTCDLGNIYYGGSFVNTVFFEADIGEPEYSIKEEGHENEEGIFIAKIQKRIKSYKFEVFVPEYVVDALVLMPLHDNIFISLTNGLYYSRIRNVEVTPTWEFNGCMATVEIKFQQDDQVVKTGCCD
jgi:hypothetical protein